MKKELTCIALATMAAIGVTHAQVYKCAGPGGSTVYSQAPCGANAQEVQVRNSAPPTNDGSDRNRAAVAQSVALSSAGIAERNCIQRAESDILGPSNRRIGDYQRQISSLNSQMARANNNLAGATWQTGLRNQIASLQQSIATERASADAQLLTARQNCGAIRRAREEEIRRPAEGSPSSR